MQVDSGVSSGSDAIDEGSDASDEGAGGRPPKRRKKPVKREPKAAAAAPTGAIVKERRKAQGKPKAVQVRWGGTGAMDAHHTLPNPSQLTRNASSHSLAALR